MYVRPHDKCRCDTDISVNVFDVSDEHRHANLDFHDAITTLHA